MRGDVKHSFLILFSLFFHLGSLTAIRISPDDRAILSKFVESIPKLNCSHENPCEWDWVSCDPSGYVSGLHLVKKNLSGEIPTEISLLSRLEKISLQGNHFYGSFPTLANLTSLNHVYLNSNNFTSVPSGFLQGLPNLMSLSIGENPKLPPWPFPVSIVESPCLVNISIEDANLKGKIPDIFHLLPSLQNLRLSNNNLTGPLPPSLVESLIQRLWLDNQDVGLSGRLDVLQSMPYLIQVGLHGNNFSGPIPDLSVATSLTDLRLEDNYLTGPVPDSLLALPSLANISLQNNNLQGPYPKFSSRVKAIPGDDSNNYCHPKPGPCNPQVNILLDIAAGFGYPSDLAKTWSGNYPCKSWRGVLCFNDEIIELHFAKHGFVGKISPSIGNITTLKKLQLNDNNLTGTIPPALAELSQLKFLDIANNNISGDVPIFSKWVTLNTSGNPLILNNNPPSEAPIQPQVERSSGGSSSSITSTNGSSSRGSKTAEGLKDSSSPKWVICIFVLVVILIATALSYIFYACIGKKRREKHAWEGYSMKGKDERAMEYAVSIFDAQSPNKSSLTNSGEFQVFDGGNVSIPIEVLREVTNNFSESNVLGRGGFGVVYKGVLHDGTKIAVKRMEAAMDSTKGLNEFLSEIAVLSKVRHRHLVALYGFCNHGNERLLVYEYMPQGTLGQWLFSYGQIRVEPLLWKQRVQIALDVARGVEYLHSLAQQSFIHRDLKPSNVLLGDDMRAKVSDFGLVKNAPDGKYSVETRLAGTFGYLAPEYASTGRVTTKIDVFAFGVILMEIITGRKALDESLPDERSHLVVWFRKYINNKDAIRTCLDPALDPDEETFESICKVAELSGHCTVREPNQRPDMGHAVNVLSPLVEEWKPTTGQYEEDSFNIDLDMSLPQALQRWQAGEGKSMALSSGYHNSFSSSEPTGTFGVPNLFSLGNIQ